MARGNGRQLLFHEERDYQRLLEGLEETVGRTGWEVFSFVWMPNHIHLFFRTPRPNLSKGMQYLLSGYANWYAKRHRRKGHLFQGRFKGELIEDESYFWNVSRYIHLNPVRGKRPLVEHPVDWRWSSYAGYARKSQRLDWMAYDVVWKAWQGEMGGKDAQRAYRSFVEAGVGDPPTNPFEAAWEGWVLGSRAFLKKIKRRVVAPNHPDQVPAAKRLAMLDPLHVISTVAAYYDQSAESYARRRSTAPGRDVAAYMAHRHTTATLRELASPFGLRHPDSVSNLIRRAQRALTASSRLKKEQAEIEHRLLKTENRV
jgi:REP element-mobilizing transposase RayT